MVNDFNRESSARVSVFVNQTGNQAPTAGSYQATLGTTATSKNIVLSQDSDPDSDPLTIYSIGAPHLGSAVEGTPQAGHRVITYSRSAGVFGTDIFTCVVTDGKGGRAVGSLQVDRDAAGGHIPVAISYATTAATWSPLSVTLAASAPLGDTLVYTVVQGPQHGTLDTTTPAGNVVVYTPEMYYLGPDAIQFKVRDGTIDSLPATITIHVQEQNFAPVACPACYLSTFNTPLQTTLTARDLQGDYLTFALVDDPAQPAHGHLSGTPPNLTYTPDTGFTGMGVASASMRSPKTRGIRWGAGRAWRGGRQGLSYGAQPPQSC
jgi:hypothetical protein